MSLIVDTTIDHRFDPNFALNLLLEVSHEHLLDRVVEILIRRTDEHPQMVCSQVWLKKKADLCATCPQRKKCNTPSHCLHLVAVGTKSASKGGTSYFQTNTEIRMPIGVGPVGTIASTARQLILRDAQKHPDVLADFDREMATRVRGISGTPVTFKGEMLGVLVAFSSEDMPDEALPWGQIFADHIGSAIANARAFDEIQRLKTKLEEQNLYLQEEVLEAKAFGDLVGQSEALKQTVSQIDLVAPTDASVLILGETGTGKDLVAHEIHRRSRRQNNSMVRVNCASIPKELFESELFGHVKGAFTGAIKDRPGRFETADGGTLFLDEIGEVALEMQAKLLRVLQDKCYERVGDNRTRRADVRIIAATNRDLKKEVEAGHFREDLYYRLHVFPIYVKTLKERKDDIPMLAAHFVNLSVKELRCPPPRLTRAAIASLQNYDWPGNVRELRNIVERAVILARGGTLHFSLPKSTTPIDRTTTATIESDYLTEAQMRELERNNLVKVLNKTRWKIKGADGAAELLGIKPTTLISRLKVTGIQRPKDLFQPEVRS